MKVFMLLIALLSCTLPAMAQGNKVTISGAIKDNKEKSPLPYVPVVLLNSSDSTFIAGGLSEDDGRFSLTGINQGSYLIKISGLGFREYIRPVLAGELSSFLDLGNIMLESVTNNLSEVVVSTSQDAVSSRMDKKTYGLSDNLTQAGSSVLEAVKNLPGVTVQDGKLQLRGSDKIMVLMDGQQTALTGFGNQSGLDNIPASAIEKIEIINNPSAKYDANGNAGIINIVYKKEKKEGFNGKVGLAGGLGALWTKKENYPSIRPQYQATPKLNPSLSLNYRKRKLNLFFQGDNLYTKTLNKNEFADRYYDDGTIIRQQVKRNRTTNTVTGKAGMDWLADDRNTFTFSGLFSSEKIMDRGDQPFFNGTLTERQRLWQFIEDELKTTVTASAAWQHKFREPGRQLNAGINYTFHREDEQYFFTNIMSTSLGRSTRRL